MTKGKVQSLVEENKTLKEEVKRLELIIQLFKQEKYGPKSEKFIPVPAGQECLFNEFEAEAERESAEKETVTYTRKKGKGKRKPFPEDLPREELIIDLADEDKVCPHDGSALVEIGEEITEKVKTVPAQTSIVIERKKKYACRTCSEHMAQAKVPAVLPGTITTAELLSFIIFSKFFQALPLYRLKELYKLSGLVIKRGTMASWMIQISQKLLPLWNVLEEKAMNSQYMAIDATHIQVLKEPGRAVQSKSSMWVRGSPELGIVLFDYDPSGGGAVAKRLMEGYSGALQADAHRGYGALDRERLVLLGCMMHARRRFYKAWVVGGKKPGIAEEGLKLIDFLYDREEIYKEWKLSPEKRKEWRNKEIAPSLEEIKKWCGWQLEKVLPSSPVGNALSYFINEYEELSAFLKEGRYEIDNGWVERVIKRFAIGRKNWLFADTVRGAQSSAILYSLALTAKLNGKNPFTAMTEVLRGVPFAEKLEDYERLADMLLSEPSVNTIEKKEGALIDGKRNRRNRADQSIPSPA